MTIEQDEHKLLEVAIEAATNEDMIGRNEINDLEAILSVSNVDRDEVISSVQNNAPSIFTWDYNKGARPSLEKLYEKSKVSMWNGETDLPWDTDVDPEAVVVANNEALGMGPGGAVDFDVTGTAFLAGGPIMPRPMIPSFLPETVGV